MAKTVLLLMLGIAAIVTTAASQTPSDIKPSFEVATIKADTRLGPSSLNKVGDRFVATALPLRPLIMEAYRVRDFQILGGPRWINDDQWDIEAKAESSTNLTWTESQDPNRAGPLARMLQSLIENRFQLKFHREPREVPAYIVTIVRSGSKLKLSADQSTVIVDTKLGRGLVEVNTQPFGNFLYFLGRQLDRPLIDKTGVVGLYDVKIAMDTGTNTRHAGFRFSNTLHRRTGTARIETGIGQRRNRHAGHRQRAATFPKLTLGSCTR